MPPSLAISVMVAMSVNTMDDLVARARAEPGKLNVAAATGNAEISRSSAFSPKIMNLEVTRENLSRKSCRR